MASEETYEVGSTVTPPAMEPYNNGWENIFGKYKTLV